ncbi:DUF932 domain-containing protein [Phytomonospora endophytica]|uniref:DUF932 domain-containing protein n=1 Tax=Phytomonospora endophytica TaxID=714109 RepID=A0A841FPJ9_9ACTN|nr:DUF932 domain-containing protein [Phytomonospora endophytica]MBB6037754.1 hypothetical protein [Phytomonospora endophytica]
MIITPGTARSVGGRLVIDGAEPVLSETGVSTTAGTYRLNPIALEGIAAKLQIPLPYLRRLRAENIDLFDTNINSWLMRAENPYMVRCLRGEDGEGMARAFLSDRYARIDNLDVLMAVLEGIRNAGIAVSIDGCDLSDRRMYLRIMAPEVEALAPTLLARYRSPFDNRSGADRPVVWGGFAVSNSETGGGAFTIKPRLMVLACRNGVVMDAAAVRRAHLGSAVDADGVIPMSEDTTTKTLALITAKTRDAVAAFLDAGFVQSMIDELEETAVTPVSDPNACVKMLGQKLRFTEDQQTQILRHFIAGADPTAGGILHAVTSAAQTLTDADAAHNFEGVAVKAMHLAAAGN